LIIEPFQKHGCTRGNNNTRATTSREYVKQVILTRNVPFLPKYKTVVVSSMLGLPHLPHLSASLSGLRCTCCGTDPAPSAGAFRSIPSKPVLRFAFMVLCRLLFVFSSSLFALAFSSSMRAFCL
ncbi:unnamed protein product, partial [Sphacelaria rigidula]